MVGGGLRGVVGDRTLLGYSGVGAGGQDEVAAETLFLPGLEGFVGDEVAAGDIEGEGEGPLIVRDMTRGVRGDEDAGGNADGVETTVSERDLVEHLADRGAIHDVPREPDGWAAVGKAGAGDADARAELIGDLFGSALRSLDVLVDAHDVSAFLDEAMGGLLADAGAGADDDDDLTGEFLLGRHALQLRFFEQPVLDVEGFLLRQGDVLVDGFGATHDFDGAVIELRRDAGFGLVLTPSDHTEAGDEDDGRVRVAHRRRVRALAGVVIGSVVLTVLLKRGGELGLQRGGVFGLGVPVHVERLDLRTEEMVGAGGAEFGEAWGVLRIDEAEDLLVVLDRADEALFLGDLAAEPREDSGEGRMALLGVEGLIEGATEDLGVTALGLVLSVDEGRGLLDHGEGQFIAGLVFVGPRDEAVLAHHDGLDGRLLAGDVLHGEAEFEARAHPFHVSHLSGEDLLGEGFAVLGSGDRDDRVRVHVVDMLAREEAVQRGVDRRGARIQVEGGVVVHADHIVFGLGL